MHVNKHICFQSHKHVIKLNPTGLDTPGTGTIQDDGDMQRLLFYFL